MGYLVPFGLAVGLSATIKPTAAPLGVVLLAMAAGYEAGWWRADGRGTIRMRRARAKHL